MTKAIFFIHRSCGANLLRQGCVRELLVQQKADVTLDDYNQNKSILTESNGNQSRFRIEFTANDTTPEAYAKFFRDGNQDATLRHILERYAVVVIKSCYPNNAIKSNAELEELKAYYRAIGTFFAKHSHKTLGIITTPPLIKTKTNPDEAKRARMLASWLAETKFGTNIHIFDFYDQLADKQTGVLRQDYRRAWAAFGIADSHPDRRANRTIAPKFSEWLATISN